MLYARRGLIRALARIIHERVVWLVSLRSRRQHRAWGEAGAEPQVAAAEENEPTTVGGSAMTAKNLDSHENDVLVQCLAIRRPLSPVPRALRSFCRSFLGFTPQALCYHPLRGLLALMHS